MIYSSKVVTLVLIILIVVIVILITIEILAIIIIIIRTVIAVTVTGYFINNIAVMIPVGRKQSKSWWKSPRISCIPP
tara:strand:+ start:115 stop:345 length:231 start_codon:yes stop_codon:yes gene_type:complete